MTINKRSKVSRARGQRWYGWGAKKKHRGAGNRGGRGMAGSGKRADQKKPTILKLYGPEYFGRHGFRRPQSTRRKINAINLGQLQSKLDDYLLKKLVSKEGDFYIVGLEKLGYNKLLGSGKLIVKLKVSAPSLSKSAIEKIENSGGSVTKENERNSE